MSKTLRNNKGQYAGSIGDGKTKTPSVAVKFTSFDPAANRINLAKEKLNAATTALQTAQEAYTAANTEFDEASGQANQEPIQQSNIYGTLEDGTEMYVTVTCDPWAENRETYKIVGNIGGNNVLLNVHRNLDTGTWAVDYEETSLNPGNWAAKMPRNPNKETKDYRIVSFNHPAESYSTLDTIYALPINQKGKIVGAFTHLDAIPEKYRAALETNVHTLTAQGIEIAHLYLDSLDPDIA